MGQKPFSARQRRAAQYSKKQFTKQSANNRRVGLIPHHSKVFPVAKWKSKSFQEVFKIAKSCNLYLTGFESLNHVYSFYSERPIRLEMLKRAPKHVQRQYLDSINNLISDAQVEDFMRACEITNYSSILLETSSSDRLVLTGNKRSCLISTKTLNVERLSEYAGVIYTNANSLAETFRNNTNPNFISNFVPFGMIPALSITYYDLRFGPKALKDLNQLSIFFVLTEYFGVETIANILNAFKTIDREPKMHVILEILKNEDYSKDFPLEWILELSE